MNYKNIFSYLTLILFSIPFAGMVFSSDYFTYIYYVYCLTFLLIMPVVMFSKKEVIDSSIYKINYWAFLLIFLLFSLATAFFSQYPLLTINRVAINFLPLFAFYLLYSHSKASSTIRFIMNFIVIIALFNGFFIVFLHLFGGTYYINEFGYINKLGPFYQMQYGEKPFYRYSGVFTNPNALSMWVLFSAVAYEFTRFKYNIKRSFWVYIVFLSLLFFSFSRAGILSFLIFYSVLFFLLSNKKRQPVVFIYTAVSVLLIGLLYIVFDVSFSSLPSDEARLSFSLNSRDFVWGQLLSSIANNPFLGVGFGVSNESILQHAGFNFSAHNLHLQMLSEVGIVGYILFLIIYFYPVFSAYLRNEISKSDFVLIAFLIAFFIHQFFENTLFRGGILHLIWFFFSYVLLSKSRKYEN